MAQGLRVLHITLEISDRKIARRYDMRITGRTFDQLKLDPKRVNNPLTKLRNMGCELVIKDWSMESPKVDEIYALIINYENRMKKKVDLVIIDYGDLVSPQKNHKESRFGLEEVYTELRRLSVKIGAPIYTA